MRRAIRGDVETKSTGQTIAEGIAVKNVGKLTLEAVRAHVDDMVLVDEEKIEQAVAAYLMLQKTMAEGAGAAGNEASRPSTVGCRGRAQRARQPRWIL